MPHKRYWFYVCFLLLMLVACDSPANTPTLIDGLPEQSSEAQNLPGGLCLPQATYPVDDLALVKAIDGFGMGSSLHLRVGIEGLDAALDATEAMGVRWVREGIPWRDVDMGPDKDFRWQYEYEGMSLDYDYLFEELTRRNFKILVHLAYDPWDLQSPSEKEPIPTDLLLERWQRFVQAVVDRYGDRIDYWEIGNQPNSYGFWGKVVMEPDVSATPDPELYTEMLKIAHQIIKKHNRNDVVVLGGLAGVDSDMADCNSNYFHYLSRLHAAGAWKYFDVVAVHPHRVGPGGRGHSPEAFIYRGVRYDLATDACMESATTCYNLTGELRGLYNLVQGFGDKPIWLTHLGWDTPWLTSRAQERQTNLEIVQADYVVRSYVAALSQPGVERVFWYTQVDPPSGTDGNWALRQPAQHALALTTALLTDSKPLGQVQGQHDRGRAEDDDVYEYRFQKDGRIIIVLWKARGGDAYRTALVSDLDVDEVWFYDLSSSNVLPEMGRMMPVTDGELQLPLNERPVFLVTQSFTAWELFWQGIWNDFTAWADKQWKMIQEWGDLQWEKFKLWWEQRWAKAGLWWDEQLEKFQLWWDGQLAKFEIWWLEQWRQLEILVADLIGQMCCGTAAMPAAVTFVWWKQRRRH